MFFQTTNTSIPPVASVPNLNHHMKANPMDLSDAHPEQMDWLDLILPSPAGTDNNLPSDPASSVTPPSLAALSSPAGDPSKTPRGSGSGSSGLGLSRHDPILGAGSAADSPHDGDSNGFDLMHMVDVIQKTPPEELCA